MITELLCIFLPQMPEVAYFIHGTSSVHFVRHETFQVTVKTEIRRCIFFFCI